MTSIESRFSLLSQADLVPFLQSIVCHAVAAAAEQLDANAARPEFVTIERVADMLGMSKRSVRRRWYDGTIPPPEKFGRSIRWRRIDIENLQGRYRG